MTGDKELLAQSKKIYFEVRTVELCFPSHCGKNDHKPKLMKLAGNLLTQLCKTSSGADLCCRIIQKSFIFWFLISKCSIIDTADWV